MRAGTFITANRVQRFLASFGALIMLSGLFTSTLMQQAVRYEVIAAESHRAEDVAVVDRASTFSAYDGNQLAIGKSLIMNSPLWPCISQC